MKKIQKNLLIKKLAITTEKIRGNDAAMDKKHTNEPDKHGVQRKWSIVCLVARLFGSRLERGRDFWSSDDADGAFGWLHPSVNRIQKRRQSNDQTFNATVAKRRPGFRMQWGPIAPINEPHVLGRRFPSKPVWSVRREYVATLLRSRSAALYLKSTVPWTKVRKAMAACPWGVKPFKDINSFVLVPLPPSCAVSRCHSATGVAPMRCEDRSSWISVVGCKRRNAARQDRKVDDARGCLDNSTLLLAPALLLKGGVFGYHAVIGHLTGLKTERFLM